MSLCELDSYLSTILKCPKCNIKKSTIYNLSIKLRQIIDDICFYVLIYLNDEGGFSIKKYDYYENSIKENLPNYPTLNYDDINQVKFALDKWIKCEHIMALES